MPNLELSDDQVLNLLEQLAPERKRQALLAMAAGVGAKRQDLMDRTEGQIRSLCAQRGLNWDSMTEEAREAFIDDLTHEERTG